MSVMIHWADRRADKRHGGRVFISFIFRVKALELELWALVPASYRREAAPRPELPADPHVVSPLQLNQLEPVLMAYDRPSPKFLSFLAKHFSLTPSVPQVQSVPSLDV